MFGRQKREEEERRERLGRELEKLWNALHSAKTLRDLDNLASCDWSLLQKEDYTRILDKASKYIRQFPQLADVPIGKIINVDSCDLFEAIELATREKAVRTRELIIERVENLINPRPEDSTSSERVL